MPIYDEKDFNLSENLKGRFIEGEPINIWSEFYAKDKIIPDDVTVISNDMVRKMCTDFAGEANYTVAGTLLLPESKKKEDEK
ncbi:hypothetical protein P162_0064 [Lactococcus phage P162]|uniref:Uncharacterized protein n=1 Tax=Lactococcus phage P162 TaxID=1476889 RepID=X4Y8D3_9CAUD|nr:hypothetical protein GJ24_gp64 [Lactococcus phage P162]AHV83261.1 hypothetical protein P162_0064 [Lactococcus phage P162]